MNRFALIALAAVLTSTTGALALGAYPPKLDGAVAFTYKTVGDVKMKLWVFMPEGHDASDKRPAIVFFFGGGWNGGSPEQFERHARYLASRGMVAAVADYRVRSRHKTTPLECVKDGRSAVRYLRTHAAKFGIDPDHIAAGGGSAGGHVAATTAACTKINETGESTAVSAEPNALALFNPGLLMGKASDLTKEQQAKIKKRFGATAPETISPYHLLRADFPPTIIFNGKADTTTPLLAAEFYVKKSTALGNRCELVTYDGQKHGFFNRDPYYAKTVIAMDKFLASLGWIEGEPTLKE